MTTTVRRVAETIGRPAGQTGQLVVDGRNACVVEVARGVRARGRGLLGRDGVKGALVLTRCGSVHTIGRWRPPTSASVRAGTPHRGC